MLYGMVRSPSSVRNASARRTLRSTVAMAPGVFGPDLMRREVFHLRPGVGLVGQPLQHPDPPGPDGVEADETRLVQAGLHDRGHRSDGGAHVAAAHLRAPLDEHHPELPVPVEAVDRQLAVAGLEHPQRQHDAGEMNQPQGEHGGDGHGELPDPSGASAMAGGYSERTSPTRSSMD